ncbi:hypothetical protein QP970_11545, partial [Corynebacterium sp. MSK073]|nr:hypothetical protein [Corynebacterium sp. MSK073]
ILEEDPTTGNNGKQGKCLGTKPGALQKVFDNPIICRQEVFRWCMRYNTRRRHSWCNLLAPDDFEALTSATLTQAA